MTTETTSYQFPLFDIKSIMPVLIVQAKPDVKDAREMLTILTFSLRSLFGDLELHSFSLRVELVPPKDLIEIDCPEDSLPSVRAALTMVTLPHYLSSTVYRFDILRVVDSQE